MDGGNKQLPKIEILLDRLEHVLSSKTPQYNVDSLETVKQELIKLNSSRWWHDKLLFAYVVMWSLVLPIALSAYAVFLIYDASLR